MRKKKNSPVWMIDDSHPVSVMYLDQDLDQAETHLISSAMAMQWTRIARCEGGCFIDCPYCGEREEENLNNGLGYHCAKCLRHFGVTTNTVLQNSDVELAKWWRLATLMARMHIFDINKLSRDLCVDVGVASEMYWLVLEHGKFTLDELRTNPEFDDLEIMTRLLRPKSIPIVKAALFKSGKQKKEEKILIRVSLEEKAVFQEAAEAEGQSLSLWIRMQLRAGAAESLVRRDEILKSIKG